MRVEPFIALRFLRKSTERAGFSILPLLGWIALGVGVWAMGSLLSVMFGFEGSLRNGVLKAYPHILVRSQTSGVTKNDSTLQSQIQKVEGVSSVVPVLETEMVAQSDFRILGVVVQGLPEAEISKKNDSVVRGSLPSSSGTEVGVLVGSELADRLNVGPGSKLELISPVASVGAFGSVAQTFPVRVTGIFTSGHYSFDQQYLYMLLRDSQDMLREGEVVSGLQVQGPSHDDALAIAAAIRKILPAGMEAKSWGELNSALFQSLKLEQFAMFMIFVFAMVVAVMNIGMSLSMYVVQKRKNIGILRTMGATQRNIRNIFFWQGFWIGGSGLCFGALLTAATLFYIRNFMTFQLPEIYYDRSIPVEIRWPWFFVIYGVATILVFVSTLYPAFKASKLNPIESLRA